MTAYRFGTYLDLDNNGTNLVGVVGAVPLNRDGSQVEKLYRRINTATTTVVLARRGTLSGVLIGKKSTGTGTMTLYDNASTATGTIIAVIDTDNAPVGYIPVQCDVSNGIVAVTTGTPGDYTIVSG